MKSSIKQYTPEWFELRSNMIGGSDVAVIMGANPWKTPLMLYEEKLGLRDVYINDAMRRGSEKESEALQCYIDRVGKNFNFDPTVFISDESPWLMASLDGYCEHAFPQAIEIKCPVTFPDDLTVPDHYYGQLQCEMYCANLQWIVYYIYVDDVFNHVIHVRRDDNYIEKMIIETKKFWNCLQSFTPPEHTNRDIIDMSSNNEFEHYANLYYEIDRQIKVLEEQKESLKKTLINLSGDKSCKGSKITVSKCSKSGSVDYSAIPQLKGVDLNMYRKAPSSYWTVKVGVKRGDE